MNAVTTIREDIAVADPLAMLRAPFPDHQISKLPKESRKQADERKAGQNAISNCKVCGGWHHKNAVHLDYVGHAALTDRLLDVDPLWSWEPVAFAQNGLPAFDGTGGLWIRLTVCGVTRLGYGNADGKQGGDAVKEIIGDALRNAAMRFGAALDLWHKGDLHVAENGEGDAPGPSAEQMAISHLRSCSIDAAMFKEAWVKNKVAWKDVLDADAYARVVTVMKECSAKLQAEAEAKAEEEAKARAAEADSPFDDTIPF